MRFERLFLLHECGITSITVHSHGMCAESCVVMWAGIADVEEELDEEMPCEPAGHGEIATG